MSETKVERIGREVKDLGEQMEDQLDKVAQLRRELDDAQYGCEDLMHKWGDAADRLLRASLPEGHPYTKPLELESDAAPAKGEAAE